MHKLLLLTTVTTVVVAVLCGSDALAQERPQDARMLLETRKIGDRVLRENVRKDTGGIVITLNEHPLAVKIFDVLKYLEQSRGKVILYSVMDNKVYVELGLFGYLGVKWQF